MANPNAKQHVDVKVREAFQAMDRDGSGEVSLLEFIVYCKKIEGMDKISDEFMKGDEDGSRSITLEELDAMVNRLPADQINDSHVTALFKKCDTDGNGSLNCEEFTALMTSQGYKGKCIDETLKKVAGGDGKVSLDEFLTAFHENE